jgi:hypothetical protein
VICGRTPRLGVVEDGGIDKNVTGISTRSPGCNTCSSKQKQAILTK